MIGRTAALLVDLAVDLTPAGWRLVPRPGMDQRRAREFLARDLDALSDIAADYSGPFKVQAAGPWTLAAGLERTRGDRAVVDAGARRAPAHSPAAGPAPPATGVAPSSMPEPGGPSPSPWRRASPPTWRTSPPASPGPTSSCSWTSRPSRPCCRAACPR